MVLGLCLFAGCGYWFERAMIEQQPQPRPDQKPVVLGDPEVLVSTYEYQPPTPTPTPEASAPYATQVAFVEAPPAQ